MPQIEAADPFPLRRVKSGPAARAQISWGRVFSAGIVAGEVAGAAMAVTMVAIFHFALDRSPFQPFEIIGKTVLATPDATADAPIVSVLGFFVHQLVPSLGWGVLFGLLIVLTRPERASTLLFLGLAIGALAQVMDAYILVPFASEHGVFVDHWSASVHPVWSWLFHFAFGVGLSIYPWKYDPSAARFV